MATQEELTAAADRLVSAANLSSTEPMPNLADLKTNAIQVLFNSIKCRDAEEEDSSWRRTKRADHIGDATEETGTRKKKIVVTCPSQHPANRFNTPHGGYTCDVCRKSQRQNTTMYGCRNCNWDACVPCHGKLLRKLQEEQQATAESTPAPAVEVSAATAELPSSTVKAAVSALDMFRKDAEAVAMLLKIARAVAFEENNRQKALRSGASLAINEHLDKRDVVIAGLAAMHNLTVKAGDVANEEAEALAHMLESVFEKYKTDVEVMQQAFGFANNLHDASQIARDILRHGDQGPFVRGVLSLSGASRQLVERGCGFLARISLRQDKLDNLVLLEKLMHQYSNDDGVCEQIILAGLSSVGTSNSSEMLSLMEAFGRARFT